MNELWQNEEFCRKIKTCLQYFRFMSFLELEMHFEVNSKEQVAKFMYGVSIKELLVFNFSICIQYYTVELQNVSWSSNNYATVKGIFEWDRKVIRSCDE
jgi:hypothetical protein